MVGQERGAARRLRSTDAVRVLESDALKEKGGASRRPPKEVDALLFESAELHEGCRIIELDDPVSYRDTGQVCRYP